MPLSPAPLPEGDGAVMACTHWLNFEPRFCTRVSFGLVCCREGGERRHRA